MCSKSVQAELFKHFAKMTKEKISFIMPYHIIEQRGGGAEVQAWLLAKELAHRGYEVSYIAQSIKGKQGWQETIDGVVVKWIRYAHHFRWSNGVDYYRAISKSSPDVVVQRMTSFITGVAGLYCKRNSKTFVWICTDNAAPFKWHFWKQQMRLNGEFKVSPAKGGVLLLNAFIYDISRHWGMKHVTYPFTQNEIQKHALKENFSLNSHRMVSGHEPPKSVMPPEKKLANGIVLWVANLGPGKRPKKFIELARLARNSELRFVMIGGRADQSYIEAIFQDKPDNLEWQGRLPFEEALKWFDQAAFFVNTSPQEGFPNTLIQAWFRGVPVFTLGVDPDGVVERHQIGVVCSSVEEMNVELKELFSNRTEYQIISANAMRYACANQSIERMTDNFLSIIRRN